MSMIYVLHRLLFYLVFKLFSTIVLKVLSPQNNKLWYRSLFMEYKKYYLTTPIIDNIIKQQYLYYGKYNILKLQLFVF